MYSSIDASTTEPVDVFVNESEAAERITISWGTGRVFLQITLPEAAALIAGLTTAIAERERQDARQRVIRRDESHIRLAADIREGL